MKLASREHQLASFATPLEHRKLPVVLVPIRDHSMLSTSISAWRKSPADARGSATVSHQEVRRRGTHTLLAGVCRSSGCWAAQLQRRIFDRHFAPTCAQSHRRYK